MVVKKVCHSWDRALVCSGMRLPARVRKQCTCISQIHYLSARRSLTCIVLFPCNAETNATSPSAQKCLLIESIVLGAVIVGLICKKESAQVSQVASARLPLVLGIVYNTVVLQYWHR